MRLDPHLTSFHSPTPSILAPIGLDMTMGTSQLLRLPDVQRVLTDNFIFLPCDLICDVSGESLIEAWMVTQSVVFPARTAKERRNSFNKKPLDVRETGRHGGLAVYYQTIGQKESVHGEATDFVAVAPLTHDEAPVIPPTGQKAADVRFNLSKLLMSLPMATVKEKMEEEKGILLRHSLVRTHGRIRLLTTFRDAHLYLFPRWVKDIVHNQPRLQSVSEDLIGSWAKSGWQDGLGEKLGLTRMAQQNNQVYFQETSFESNIDAKYIDPRIDIQRLSTTKAALSTLPPKYIHDPKSLKAEKNPPTPKPADLPQLLAYVHRGPQFIRRVDSPPVLLSTSLALAKLPSIEDVGRQRASPFAHARKISSPELIAPRSIVTESNCLLGINVVVESSCVVKESCIAPNCRIMKGARIIRCVLMEGAVVEARAQLTGCIIGRHARIGREAVLRDCEVQDANALPEMIDAKGQRFMVFDMGK